MKGLVSVFCAVLAGLPSVARGEPPLAPGKTTVAPPAAPKPEPQLPPQLPAPPLVPPQPAPSAPKPEPPAPAPPPSVSPAPEPAAPVAPPPGQPPPAPYGSWNSARPYPAPPTATPPPPPLPLVAPPEYARRSVELVPALILASPACTNGTLSNARCDGMGGGIGAGFAALWRVSPYFAFGGTLDIIAFNFDPPAQTGLTEPAALGAFVGLLGRVYFMDRGRVEPYLELGLGGGLVATSARERSGSTYGESAAGGAVRLGAGVEFFLNQRLKLGPAIDWTRFGTDTVRRCRPNSDCVDLPASDYAHGTGFLSISARLTILLGQAL
jgi:hypothetical protein